MKLLKNNTLYRFAAIVVLLFAFVQCSEDESTAPVEDNGSFKNISNNESVLDEVIDYSPNSEIVVFTRNFLDNSPVNYWAMDVDGNNVRQLTSDGFTSILYSFLSPDGKYFYAANMNGSLIRYDVGGPQIQLEQLADNNAYPVDITADGNYVIVYGNEISSETRILNLNANTDNVIFSGSIPIAITSDSKTLFYYQSVNRQIRGLDIITQDDQLIFTYPSGDISLNMLVGPLNEYVFLALHDKLYKIEADGSDQVVILLNYSAFELKDIDDTRMLIRAKNNDDNEYYILVTDLFGQILYSKQYDKVFPSKFIDEKSFLVTKDDQIQKLSY